MGSFDASSSFAATVRDMFGFVVSCEIVVGVEVLNDMCLSGGFVLLCVVVVDFVCGGEGEEFKLSSTRFRERDVVEG